MNSMFGDMLRRTLEAVPGAEGAIFADWEGEAVDQVGRASIETLRLLGAHIGIILNLVQRWLNLLHFGEAHELLLHFSEIDVIVRVVDPRYYLVMLVRRGAHLSTALLRARELANELAMELR